MDDARRTPGTKRPHERIDPYEDDEPMWSGNPNDALVAELGGARPGRALDVGSGEGADAVWLAQHGWHVVGLEPSPAALRRAHAAAAAAGVEVDWVEATLLEASLPPASFDLVTCCYPALFRSPGRLAEQALTGLVAPGGALLVVVHADVDRERALEHGFDPDDYVDLDDVRAVLGAGWTIETDDRRARHVTTGQGAHHHTDLVLRARRG